MGRRRAAARKPTPTRRTPRARPAVTVDHEQRSRYAETLLAKQWAYARVRDEIVRKYKVCDRTARGDLQLAFDRLKDSDDAERGNRKRVMRSTWKAQYEACMKRGELQAGNRALIELGRLDGLYDPKRIEIGGTVGIAVTQQLVVDALDDAGLAALDVVLAQLEAAGVALLPPGGRATIDVAIADELATADVSKLS